MTRGAALAPRCAVAGHSTRGSAHVREGRPLEDAVLTWAEHDRGAVAVADGHGHDAHFRSAEGASFAAAGAVDVIRHRAPDMAAAPDPAAAESIARLMVDEMLADWARRIEEHLLAHPLTGSDGSAGPLTPYGTTLLAAAVTGPYLALWQLGDGDIVTVSGTEGPRRPLPVDPSLDGVRTPSLCQPDAAEAMRVCLIDLTAADIELAFLCTDGFGAPRVDATGWWRETGTQLSRYVRDRGMDWVRDQLPRWLEEPALTGGDDTTLAVISLITRSTS